ncbi:MAG: (2Fe-2S)-binding protein [Geminicoccaceae bacterium]
MSVSVTINGTLRTLREGRTLLHALREDLGLRGTRFGCGEESCGACLVIVDGAARPSCTADVGELEGAVVETVEALGPAEAPSHPLARAVLELQAAQCGYCLPGILMAAKALLDQDPCPDEATIRAALDGNLCRCGAHLRILAAIRRAAEEMAAP